MSKFQEFQAATAALDVKSGRPIPGALVYRNAANILRSDNPGRFVDTVNEMFTWDSFETPGDLLSPEDQATLKLNPGSFEPDEAKRVVRRQKKARKRLKRLEREQETVSVSKVTRRVTSTATEMMSVDKFRTVDALSSAAVFAPFLDPDQIVAFLEGSVNVEQIWKPPVSIMPVFVSVGMVLDEISDKTVTSDLVQSFHGSARNGKWWDVTAGKASSYSELRHADMVDDAPDVVDEDVEPLMDVTARNFVDLLLAGELEYGTEVLDVAGRVRPTSQQRVRLHQLSNDRHAGSDVKVLVASMSMNSMFKPHSPMPDMGTTLLDAAEFVTDTKRWREAREWVDVYPEQSTRVTFDVPERILALDGMVIDGIGFQLIGNGADLHYNADQMGNCTFAQKRALQNGSSTMWRIYHNGQIWNAQTTFGNAGSSQIQGSQKRLPYPGTPPEVNSAWKKLIEQMKRKTL